MGDFSHLKHIIREAFGLTTENIIFSGDAPNITRFTQSNDSLATSPEDAINKIMNMLGVSREQIVVQPHLDKDKLFLKINGQVISLGQISHLPDGRFRIYFDLDKRMEDLLSKKNI